MIKQCLKNNLKSQFRWYKLVKLPEMEAFIGLRVKNKEEMCRKYLIVWVPYPCLA